MMATLGIIGGIAPESTIEYYRLVVARHRERTGHYPRVIINSIDLDAMIALVGAGQFAELTDFFLAEIEKLARAGAELALFASNTPHIVFAEVAARSPLPLVSIVDAARDEAKALGLRRVGLFGTRFTMQASFYRDSFAQADIEIVAPEEEEQRWIHEKYMGELVNAVFRPKTRARLLEIAARMKRRHAIEGLILGGTELPLILRDAGALGILLVDTTRVHVERAVERMVGDRVSSRA